MNASRKSLRGSLEEVKLEPAVDGLLAPLVVRLSEPAFQLADRASCDQNRADRQGKQSSELCCHKFLLRFYSIRKSLQMGKDVARDSNRIFFVILAVVAGDFDVKVVVDSVLVFAEDHREIRVPARHRIEILKIT